MKKFCQLSVLMFLVIYPLGGSAQTKVKLLPSEDAPHISRHIYGHFAEHLGRGIYDGLYVGEDSEIPNKAGVRNDLIEALKRIKIPNLRWPGGCFADTYHWKDGIGPKEERPTVVNQWWGGTTEDNSFGTHDFLNLCEELGAEPYLAANVGSGTVKELADWVQYVNHAGKSPMADLRKINDREKPWDVKYWGVGNEMWGCGGNMTAEYYANIYKQYATFMADWSDSSDLYRIASGASDNDYHWTEVLMREVPKHLIEGVALHYYAVIDWDDKGPSFGFTEAQYFQTMEKALRMEELIEKHVAVMDKYDAEKEIDLVVDEWGGWYDAEGEVDAGVLYQQSTMRDAMIAGVTLNIFNNHSERVKMANLAQTVNVLQAVALTEGERMLLTPTYHVLEMYTIHHDSHLIPVEFDSPEYRLNGKSLSALSISASRGDDDKVSMSLVNIDSKITHSITVDLSGMDIAGMQGRILTSEKLQDYNTFEEGEKISPISFIDFEIKNGNLKVNLPPFSVVVLTEE